MTRKIEIDDITIILHDEDEDDDLNDAADYGVAVFLGILAFIGLAIGLG